jgi:hypothetical protein
MFFLINLADLMRKRQTLTIIMVLMGLVGLSDIQAQQQSIGDYLAECERKYGSDASLVNGEKYFYPYSRSDGDPFFFSEPRQAVIRVHEKEFAGQPLRFDIFNQQVILDVKDIYGGITSLVLRNEWVESFSFESHVFKRMDGPEGKVPYYQVVVDGPIACVYSWSKDYLMNLNSGVQSYYFTEALKKSYLVIDNAFFPYRNNRSFLKAFDSEQQKTIKQFMRQSKIRVSKSPDWQMRHLIEYCNTLPHEDS